MYKAKAKVNVSGSLIVIGLQISMPMVLNVPVTPRYIIRDHWIKDSIKQIFNSGLFWAVWAAEKKIQTVISMLLLRTVFLCFMFSWPNFIF